MRAGMGDRKRTNREKYHSGGRRAGALRLLPAVLLLALFLSGAAWATELQIPALKAKSGQDIKIPLIIDQIGNLAGVKLILHYDKEILTFKEGNKSPATQSLMHIINDKTPGKLIIVMAGARGIQGKETTILTLSFTVKKGLTSNHITVIEIPEVQLMGDDLKEIECKVKAGAMTILP
jgi:hypothetical protein